VSEAGNVLLHVAYSENANILLISSVFEMEAAARSRWWECVLMRRIYSWWLAFCSGVWSESEPL
jgi:hypothetical protein